MKNMENTVKKMFKLSNIKGFDPMCYKPVSNSVEDWYLLIVLVMNEKKEYVTYLYNSTLGDNGGYVNGHYFTDYDKAWSDFDKRS